MRNRPRRNSGERGNSIIEFALCMTFMVPLLLGSITVGMGIGRSLQASQVARDVGHMYARQSDFSQTGMQDVVVKISAGLGMTRTAGTGVVILSKLLMVGDEECTGGGIAVASCSNRNKIVVTHRVVIGNASYDVSKYATPTPAIVGSNGDITPSNYLLSNSTVATGFSNVLNLQAGEEAYLVEAYFANLDFLSGSSTAKLYSRAIF